MGIQSQNPCETNDIVFATNEFQGKERGDDWETEMTFKKIGKTQLRCSGIQTWVTKQET